MAPTEQLVVKDYIGISAEIYLVYSILVKICQKYDSLHEDLYKSMIKYH